MGDRSSASVDVSTSSEAGIEGVLRIAAQLGVCGVETLREQLGLFGLSADRLSADDIAELHEIYFSQSIEWKFFVGHADAAAAFASRRGLKLEPFKGDAAVDPF